MDSVYAGKYRYSPERLKKAESCQGEDFPVAGRPERRRSEPAKQIVRSTRAFLKHADSEGALPGDSCSLRPASSVSTLASSVGEPPAEGPGEEEEEEAAAEEEVEERSPTRHSVEQMCPSDADPKLDSAAPSEGGLEEEEEAKPQREQEVEVGEEEDCYKEDILMGDDQVADFASTMLEAISCWHYRARALLTAPYTTDVQSMEAAEETDAQGDVLETSTQEPPASQEAQEEAIDAQVSVAERSVTPSHCEEEQEVDCTLMEVNHSQLPDSPASPTLPAEDVDTDPDPDPYPNTQDQLDSSTDNGDEKEVESDCSRIQPEDCSMLSFGEHSEEDEEMLNGVLPSTVSDAAGAIVEHPAGSVSRRSSLVVSEDPCSVASPSPQPESPQPPEEPSLRSELREEVLTTLDNASSEPMQPSSSEEEASQPVCPAAHEDTAQEDTLGDVLGDMERRSTLSKQDRLLIHKIRRYYEYAEHQDASFSIKRRESLSYIPTGLVRHLSKQLNSAPQGTPPPVHRKGSSPGRPTSWSVFDLPGLEKNHRAESVPGPQRRTSSEASTRPSSAGDASTADEDFRPSSDMLNVWNDMELGMNSCPEEPPVFDHSDKEISPGAGREETPISRDLRSDMLEVKARERPLQILEECELEPLSEQSSISAPATPLSGSESEYAEDSWPSTPPRSCGKGRVARAPLPRIISLRSGLEDDQILQDMGKMKNKVFQLARQYSQRIKNNRPLIRQRNRDSENLHGLKMPAVHEESMPSRENGEHNLTYPLNTYDQVNAVAERQAPPSNPSPSPSSRATTPQAMSSPSSPSPAPSSPVDSEAFHWPDVHELCSKYTGPRSAPGPASNPRVGRSCSVPERMLESCADGLGRLMWSTPPKQQQQKHHHHLPWDSAESQPGVEQRRGSPAAEDGRSPPARRQLCRWSSLDSMPVATPLPLNEVQNLQDPVRNGLATMPTIQHNKVIVVEWVPGSPLVSDGRTVGEQEVATTGNDGSLGKSPHSVSKRPAALRASKKTESKIVKNLREKFQSLSSGS